MELAVIVQLASILRDNGQWELRTNSFPICSNAPFILPLNVGTWKWSISSFDSRFFVRKCKILWQAICPIGWLYPVLSPHRTKKMRNVSMKSISICMINSTIWPFLSTPLALTFPISWHLPRTLKRCIVHPHIISASLYRSTAKSSGRISRCTKRELICDWSYQCWFYRWHERAREKAWKKFGGRFFLAHTKRVYPKEGLLGYKVLVDGYNHTFEAPPTQGRAVRSGSSTRSNQTFAYGAFSDEERTQIAQMKSSMKQYVMDERQRAKQLAAAQLQQLRRPPNLLPRSSSSGAPKPPAIAKVQWIRSQQESSFSMAPSQNPNQSSTSALAPSVSKSKTNVDTASTPQLQPSTIVSITTSSVSSSKGQLSLVRFDGKSSV